MIPTRHTPQYKQRIRKVRSKVKGTRDCPRLAVFCGTHSNQVQLIDDTNGKTLASANDLKLNSHGTIKSAEQIGHLITELAIKKGIKKAVLDRRGRIYHGRIKAIAEAARAGGLKI